MSILHEARGGLADGLRERLERRRAVEVQREAELEKELTRKEAADWASGTGRDMWLAGIQECLRLAKIYVKSEQDRVFDETAQPYDEIDWAKFEKQLERL